MVAMLLPLAGTAEDSIVVNNATIGNDDIIIEPMESDEALPIETEISLGGEPETTAMPEGFVQGPKDVLDDLTLDYKYTYAINANGNKRIDMS